MKRFARGEDGYYHIHGKTYSDLVGSRAQVWHGTAYKTIGNLCKNDLLKSHGRIVSKVKHNTAKKENRLVKAGYGTKKGKFGFVLLNSKKSKKSRTKKTKGGYNSSKNLGYSLLGGHGNNVGNGDKYSNINENDNDNLGANGSATWKGDKS